MEKKNLYDAFYLHKRVLGGEMQQKLYYNESVIFLVAHLV